MELPKKPSKRELKTMEIEKHNAAYLKSKEPKTKKPISKSALRKAATTIAIISALNV